MPENISMEEFLSLTPGVEEEKEKEENIISKEEFLAMGKTTGSTEATPIGEPNVMESESDDGSLDLPGVTRKDVRKTEENAILDLRQKYEGLGFSFEETGLTGDWITITAPPEYEGQPEEERATEEFSFDMFWGNIFGADKKEANRLNSFIQEHYKKGEVSKGINANVYAETIKYTNTKPISFKNEDGSVKKIEDLTAQELEQHQQEAFNDMFENENVWGGVLEDINSELESYIKQQTVAISKKYDLTKENEVYEANKELEKLARAKNEELINASPEFQKLIKSVNAAVTSKYGGKDIQGSLINRKYVLEAEKEFLPVASAIRKIPLIGDAWADASHGVGVGRIQVAKGNVEYSKIIAPELALRSDKKEIEDLQQRIKDGASLDEKYIKRSKPSVREGTTTIIYEGTIGDRIKELEKGIPERIRTIQEGVVSSTQYQKKLSALDPAEIFDESIFNPQLTTDEFQKMVGTQGTQMVAGIFLYPTFAQESGGIAIESTVVEAARKTFPNLDDEKAKQAFEQLIELEPEKATKIMTQVITNGEVDFDPAIKYGGAAASLDIVSNFFVWGKAVKGIPMSTVRDMLRGRIKKVVTSKGAKAVYGATGIETVTESLQEKLGFEGVEAATGYGGVPEENIKRMLEGAGQALITTPVLVGGGKVTASTYKEFKAKVFANPRQARKLINQEKTKYQQAFEDGMLSQEEKDNIFTELEAVEDMVNNIDKYKKMDNDSKEITIENLTQLQLLKQEKLKYENDNKKIQKEQPGAPTFLQLDNKNKIKEIEKKMGEHQAEIIKELLVSNYFQDGRIAEWINNSKEGDFKNKTFKRFENKEQAKEYFSKMFEEKGWIGYAEKLKERIQKYQNEGLNVKEAREKAFEDFNTIGDANKLQTMLDMKSLYDGDKNAAVQGNTAWVIDENIVANIRKGDPTSTNAFHHEGFHWIQANMSRDRLKEIKLAIEKELEATTDPKLLALHMLVKDFFSKRYEGKYNKNSKAYYDEWFSNLSDAMKYISATDLNENNSETLFNIGKIFGDMFKKQTQMGLDWSKFDSGNALDYIKKWNSFQGVSTGLTLRIPRGKVNTEQEDKKEENKVLSSEVYQEINQTFQDYVDIDRELASNVTAEMMQGIVFDRLIKLKDAGLIEGFKTKDLEDIQLQFTADPKNLPKKVKNRGAVGLLMKFEKDFKGGVMGYFNATVRGRKMLDMRLQEFVENHPKYGNIQVSLQEEGVTKAVEAQQTALSPEEIMIQKEEAKLTELDRALSEGKAPRTDVLRTGKRQTREQIMEVVKFKDGDTFTEVLDIKNINGNTGKVAEIVFDVPAKKILDRNENGKPISANLTYAKKIIDGIPEPSEAGNIQDYYANEQAITSEIKTLPKTNVASKDAEINKDGDKIKVSRETLGRAVGLSNNVLNYFYNKKFKPDGKRARSQGLSSQVGLWELKDEFINPKPEIVKKAQKEFFGITPVGQLNIYNKTIGQNLKGFAKHTAGKKALSAAARKSDDPQQIADIRAGISNITAFSESMKDIDLMHKGVINTQFEGDLKRINDVLNKFIEERAFKHSDQTEIDNYFEAFEKTVLGSLPANMFGANPASVFSQMKKSKRVLPNKGKDKITLKDGEIITINDYFDRKRNVLKDRINNGKVKFGKPFTGEGNKYVYGKSYADMYAINPSTKKPYKSNDPRYIKAIEKSFHDGTREKYNAIHDSMHRQFMERVNTSIRSNPKNAKVWGNYFSFVGQDVKHPFRMGAEWVLYSKNPIGAEGKFYEWEHAMMATRAYLYLLQTSLEKVEGKYYDFDLAYDQVMDNYKLIALDNYDDKVKLGGSGRQKTMGEDWSFLVDWFGDRYWDEPVAAIKGINGYGINPKSLLGEGRKTAAEIYNVNIEGKIPGMKIGINKNKKLNKAIVKARTTKFSETSQGITVLDFDDTLATTKSGVRATILNPEGNPKPKRKAILLAGGAGSGKSNVVKQLGLVDSGFKVVNQDIALEWLKKNAGIPTDMRDLTKEQLSKLGKLGWEARKIAKRKYGKFKGQGDGVVIDGTGGSIKTIETQKAELEAAGYDVQMIFVETSLDVALERNRARKERSLRDSIVKRNHEAVQNNKEAFKKLFGNGFLEVNTDNLKQNDPMPIKLVNQVNEFVSGYEKRRLDAEEFAREGADLLAQGAKFDFSEFNVVTEGQVAPLFNKALKLQKKFGNKDMFVLTARPPESASHIFEFLKANGLNIPLKNITGLGNSTAEAKALWMADKVGEGYNDFYFADDALQNVQAVKNMLDQFDVKSKIQQAKVKFSETMSDDFNNILENVSGIDAKKRFSAVKARKRGESKGKFRFFIPPSHEDFVGLLYNFIGRGKEGNAHRDFFEKALVRPLNRAFRELNTARQSIANDYKSLNKQFENVKKKLNKKTPDGDFTYQDAIRVYLWDKHGYDIPGLSKVDQQKLVDLVMSDRELQNYAENLNIISKRDNYVKPSEGWEVTDIRMDLDDATGKVGRAEFFTEFLENAKIIFSPENLNKIEAIYGPDMVSAIKDMLYRIETGRNRPSGQNKIVNGFMNWFNASVASTMFINVRSVVLQQMSLVNFINYSDNNILAAAKAFANQKQYWADWAFLFNSDFMKQRRGGIKTDVNGAELAESLKGAKNNPVVLLGKLLQFGFKPTQIGDNVAIATGGAPYYRNRINTYLKQGLSQKEAEAKAFVDFQVLAEATQQSARPDMVSQQQASPLGKVILAFQNVTSQFNRLGKKAFLDIKNRRISPEYRNASNPQLQSDISNLSRIAYYFAIQNLIFYSLQSALFMMMFDDNEDDEKFLKKKERVINGTIDSILRGTGVWGAVVATLKNMTIKRFENEGKDWNANEYSVLVEGLQVSPPLGARVRKLVKAERELIWDKDVIDEMETFDIENPLWPAVTNYVEGTTNAPANRTYNLTLQAKDALDNQFTVLQRVFRGGGWGRWDLGIEDVEKSKKKQDFGGRKRTTPRTRTTRTRTRDR